MLDELKKYKSNGHFFVNNDSDLKKVCNAPKKGFGIYVIYQLSRGKIELIYIESSGKIKLKGKKIQGVGIYDSIVHEKQFGDIRSNSWIAKMKAENIDAFDVYWFETFNDEHNDLPNMVKGLFIQSHFEWHGTLPKWNEEF